MTELRFERLTSTCYTSTDWEFVLERLSSGWTVREHGRLRKILPTLNEAKRWTRDFVAGRVI